MNYIHPTAVISQSTTIEDNVYIGPLCVIGFPAEWKGHEEYGKGVIIRSGARLTGLVTVDSGADRATEIGANCYLMKHSHVGHDAKLGEGVTVSCGAKIGGHTEIGDGTNIGLNAVIHQKLKVPGGCMIGMGAVVTKRTELKEGMKYVGNPARLLSENKRP